MATLQKIIDAHSIILKTHPVSVVHVVHDALVVIGYKNLAILHTAS